MSKIIKLTAYLLFIFNIYSCFATKIILRSETSVIFESSIIFAQKQDSLKSTINQTTDLLVTKFYSNFDIDIPKNLDGYDIFGYIKIITTDLSNKNFTIQQLVESASFRLKVTRDFIDAQLILNHVLPES